MNISVLVNEYLKQNIQSEAEVRSKLIVPLLETLGYPKDLRAEEFPVYGYEGSKALTTKSADFLQFISNDFASHRGKSKSELEWVYNHSLLVFEAKKPTEKILVKGQPVFYAAWTKSVAYMISNGEIIEGYIVNANYSDTCVFSCLISEIPEKWEQINKLNYDNILTLKKNSEYTDKWTKVGTYDAYKNIMRIRCVEELYASVDRILEKVSYTPNIIQEREKRKYEDILDETSKIITSEPGGGKSYLIHMLMRDYLSKYDKTEEKIPIILEGRYFGKVYNSITEGIYKELNIVSPFITSEIIEKRLHEGGFIILFDALDEVEYKYDVLMYELHQLRRDTSSTIIVTSRSQNYKDELCTDFIHYSLEQLSDKQVSELLSKYSKGKIQFNIHQIPKRLLELIKTPLFLKLFISISQQDDTFKIPTNHAALFELYIAEKFKLLSCSIYEETIIKQVLAKYAVYSHEKGDSTEQFVEILNEFCKSHNNDKIYNIIWKTGIICNGLQGIKYFHKAMHEFFVALYFSQTELSTMYEWLSTVAIQEKYDEIICYLTGIISNQQKQNYVLDYLERHNFKLYVKALKSRHNFTSVIQEINLEYAEKYYNQMIKSYKNIIETHFNNICGIFDGYNIQATGKVCIKGNINSSSGSISLSIYNGNLEEKELEIKISSEKEPKIIFSNGISSPIQASVFTINDIHERYFNLELLSYGLDSAREIAIDIIKEQIKNALENKFLFDHVIDVLMIETIENFLRKLRYINIQKNHIDTMSLYTNSITDIIAYLKSLNINTNEANLVTMLCKLLLSKKCVLTDYLDIEPDLKIDKNVGRFAYDMYSDNQLLEKIKKNVYLISQAVYTIVNDYIPVLSTVYINTQIIGVVYRQDGNSGFEFIEVKTNTNKLEKPIIEYKKEKIDILLKLDQYFLDQLSKIEKTEKDIICSSSSTLYNYFGNDVFHKLIYEQIKKLFSNLFGTYHL
ncbi:MAG: hypothetical protein J1F11_03685 [Oscillospiraceae bacterium]|nr:hypothetical protein [Oscillospiraceae bacterium]